MAAPSLPCCTQAFFSWGKRGLFSSCDVQTSHCAGFSCGEAWAPGRAGFSSSAHGLSCPTASGIFLDQGLNLCPLHRQGDSEPLDHPESLPTVLETSAYSSFPSLLD